ncbi:hypothetical protein MWU49_13755 [Alcanivorax sp. S6407]|uniref:hypothetical protein n=1 Tax=Alcanivorax sp. S6407 TaxID=2926424 RepID=UPI001FF20BC8|nr:hypothetical protein [Alcanivorax sp. S6407]MCK0154780.1 hypothetical protein [Alcanivorax sp. S6407]
MVMETIERPQREETGGLEKALRWLLILMLGAVFVTRFLPGMVQFVSTLPETLERSVLIQQGFAILLLVNALLLLAERTWAFLLLYVTLLLATLIMGVSLVPWVVGLMREDLATETVIAANIVMLLLAAWCHWLQKNRCVSDRS